MKKPLDLEKREYKWTPTQDRRAVLHMDAHYTDERFRKEQIVFGNMARDLQFEYDDRLAQWDYEKHKAAWQAARDAGHALRTADFYEAYLSAYFANPISLRCVIVGVNRSNGYPYAVFGFVKNS